jgi:hypothetical protein
VRELRDSHTQARSVNGVVTTKAAHAALVAAAAARLPLLLQPLAALSRVEADPPLSIGAAGQSMIHAKGKCHFGQLMLLQQQTESGARDARLEL